MSEIDLDKIKSAVREYNAAENSLRRALGELREVIPAGVTVLHKIPGKDGLYWSYESPKDGGHLYEGVQSDEDADVHAIIIEAPARRTEHLPRLEKLHDQ